MPEMKRPARGGASLPGEADFRRRLLFGRAPARWRGAASGKMDSIIRICRFFQIVRKAKKNAFFMLLEELHLLSSG